MDRVSPEDANYYYGEIINGEGESQPPIDIHDTWDMNFLLKNVEMASILQRVENNEISDNEGAAFILKGVQEIENNNDGVVIPWIAYLEAAVILHSLDLAQYCLEKGSRPTPTLLDKASAQPEMLDLLKKYEGIPCEGDSGYNFVVGTMFDMVRSTQNRLNCFEEPTEEQKKAMILEQQKRDEEERIRQSKPCRIPRLKKVQKPLYDILSSIEDSNDTKS